jgi:hypothetical protein
MRVGELEPQPIQAGLSEREQRIADRLDELSETLGDLFRATVREIREKRDRSWIRLAAHASRELVNRLPDYVDLPVAGKRLDYASRFRAIAEQWPADATEQPGSEVIDLVVQLVEDDRAASASIRARAEALFDALETGEMHYAGDAAARAQLWVELQRYFPGVAHVSGPGVPEPDPEVFERNFVRLERLLASQFRAEGYYETQAELDELLAKAEPDEEDADAVIALLRGELYRSFFERASSPRWLQLLKARGYFRSPPQRIVEAPYIRHPGWPESRYLIKIAPQVPDEVAATIVEMAPTDNARVHGDLLEAALEMPTAAAARRVADLVGDWLDDSFLMLVADRSGQLVAKLAEGGEVDAATHLARQLLALREVPAESDAGYGALFEVRGRIDEWEYQQVLEKHLPSLVAADPFAVIRLLRDVLRAAILMERKRWQTERDDGMKIVRHRIDQHESFPAIENALVTTLRDVVVAHANEHPGDATTVMEILDGQPEVLFRRLELHLASAVDVPELAEMRQNLLLSDELYASYAAEDEYEQLLAAAFGSLDLDLQRRLVERIETGPDNKYRELLRERIADDHQPTDAELEDRWERWRLRKLAPIKEALTGDDAERYTARVARYGEPSYPEESRRSAEYTGLTGLLGVDELRAMDGEEILQSLQEWEAPSAGWDAPSREGQARALDILIAEEPHVWAARAAAFKALPPIYSRHLLQTLDSAVNANTAIELWEPLLELAEHVVEQPPEEGVDPTDEDDVDYRPSRRALAHLLRTALWKRAIPLEHRERIWRLINALAHDSDPSLDRDLAAADPASASINATRGIALQAAVGYGVWCARELPEKDRSFEPMPELRILLEEKLDRQHEPSPTVHAVFGQFLPYLLYLDRGWTEQHVAQVFPKAADLDSFYVAAWGAFVRFARFDRDTVALLLPEFLNALSRPTKHEGARRNDEGSRLAEYVGEIYVLDLDDPEQGVVDAFFESAPAEARTHAVRHLGLELRRAEMTDEQRERLLQLWSLRLAALVDRDPELAEFGWWFSTQRLDAGEAISLLVTTLEKSGGVIDSTKEVIEALATTAGLHQESALRSLELLIAGTEWHLLDYARDPIRSLLETVFATGTEAHKEQARRAIHSLGEKGVHGMQHFLAVE